jgi:hypothetical protein
MVACGSKIVFATGATATKKSLSWMPMAEIQSI